jgi:hypothetical protein
VSLLHCPVLWCCLPPPSPAIIPPVEADGIEPAPQTRSRAATATTATVDAALKPLLLLPLPLLLLPLLLLLLVPLSQTCRSCIHGPVIDQRAIGVCKPTGTMFDHAKGINASSGSINPHQLLCAPIEPAHNKTAVDLMLFLGGCYNAAG